MFWIWWKVLDTIILWQDVGPCCEQTHAPFEVGLSLDHGQGVYSGWSDVVVSSQLRLCHMCIIDVVGVGDFPDGMEIVHGKIVIWTQDWTDWAALAWQFNAC